MRKSNLKAKRSRHLFFNDKNAGLKKVATAPGVLQELVTAKSVSSQAKLGAY